jgi:hypothetical protein
VVQVDLHFIYRRIHVEKFSQPQADEDESSQPQAYFVAARKRPAQICGFLESEFVAEKNLFVVV